jgi:5-carboxymethyl-2-hydroxymuconate isomerase
MLSPDGTLSDRHGVHVFVEWHEGRTKEQKQEIGDAIREFLEAHGLADGLDITFRDSRVGESYYFEGRMVGV